MLWKTPLDERGFAGSKLLRFTYFEKHTKVVFIILAERGYFGMMKMFSKRYNDLLHRKTMV